MSELTKEDLKVFTAEFDDSLISTNGMRRTNDPVLMAKELADFERDKRACMSVSPESRVKFKDKLAVSSQQLMFDLDTLGIEAYERDKMHKALMEKLREREVGEGDMLLNAMNKTMSRSYEQTFLRPNCGVNL